MTVEKKTRIPKPEPEHKDILGRKLTVGDFVAVTIFNDLKIAKVIKLNPKMVKVKVLDVRNNNWYRGEHNRYSGDMVIVDGPYISMYIIKNSA
jgi:hypothetical protein